MKYLILLAGFVCSVAASHAYAQQTTGGLNQNKKQAIEALNAIRFQQIGKAVEDSHDAMAKIEENNRKAMEELQQQNSAEVQGLNEKITKLEALVYRLASCKPKTIDGCQLPQTNFEDTANGTCGDGKIFIRPVPVGQFYFGPQCSYKCGESGQTKVVNHCGEPKNCSAKTNLTLRQGIMAVYTFASLPGSTPGTIKTTTCSTGNIFGGRDNYTTCKAKCQPTGEWSFESVSGCTNCYTGGPINIF